MEARNLDFEIPVTQAQWEQIARRAADLGRDGGGYEWTEEDPDRIRVFLRKEEASGLWDNFVSEEETYGEPRREIARFLFNGGRPHAEIEMPASAVQPAFNNQETQAMQIGLERWVRDRWHHLLRESGLHYDRGHIPQS